MQMLAHAFHHHFRAEPNMQEEKSADLHPQNQGKVHNVASVIKTCSKSCCRFHHLALVEFHLFKT